MFQVVLSPPLALRNATLRKEKVNGSYLLRHVCGGLWDWGTHMAKGFGAIKICRSSESKILLFESSEFWMRTEL